MKPTVFIHTNHKQIVGAMVSAHSMRRNSRHADSFDVRIIHTKDYPLLREMEGRSYLMDGAQRSWRYDDLQSFTTLRFMPPELMGYAGRSVVVDPDVFAVGDIWELLSRDLDGGAIMCRPRSGSKEQRGFLATSVMLLDCARLTHWRWEEQLRQMFTGQRDYMQWMCLQYEPVETIRLFENEWNDFDQLTPRTKLLHNTKRQTQPWKTGLPIDFTVSQKTGRRKSLLKRIRNRVFGERVFRERYKPHPDVKQEEFFFGLLRECMDEGIVSEDMLRSEMRDNHIRHDAREILDRIPSLAA